MILKAEPLDPSFQWRGHKPERPRWQSIGFLLAIAVGAGFFVGRLSTAAPGPTAQRTIEQQTETAGSAVQSTPAQQDATAAARSSTISTDTKPAPKEETKAATAASSTEAPKAQSAAAAEKGSSSPPVVLINPSTADKGAAGETTKKAVPKTEAEAPAKTTAKAESHEAADDAAPAAAVTKRKAKSNASAAPVRQESVASRRDDSYVASRRDDSHVASRRDDAYVPPRVPQTAFPDRRERYDGVERKDDRARLEQPYPDRRYADDAPPPRTYNDLRREYLRPFRESRDAREYRRFGGYDDDPYVDRRPVLRPMYGGRDD